MKKQISSELNYYGSVQFEIKWLVLSCLAIWSGCCYFVHGPAILYYLGIHLSTSGVFSYIMLRDMA